MRCCYVWNRDWRGMYIDSCVDVDMALAMKLAFT